MTLLSKVNFLKFKLAIYYMRCDGSYNVTTYIR